jgi:dCMP deaminase
MDTSLSKWDKRFIDLANHIASWSKDETQVGCVIVGQNKEILSTGYNGFPYRVEEKEERNNRPTKYLFTEHAERNAIYHAARNGISLKGSTLYLSNLHEHVYMPCADCARAIIQSGISKVVCCNQEFKTDSIWYESIIASCNMLLEAGIELVLYKKEKRNEQLCM